MLAASPLKRCQFWNHLVAINTHSPCDVGTPLVVTLIWNRNEDKFAGLRVNRCVPSARTVINANSDQQTLHCPHLQECLTDDPAEWSPPKSSSLPFAHP